METTPALFEYLADCSDVALQSFEISRLNEIANLRKQLMEIVEEWVAADAQARLAEWLLATHRAQASRRGRRNARRREVGRANELNLRLFPAPAATLCEIRSRRQNGKTGAGRRREIAAGAEVQIERLPLASAG